MSWILNLIIIGVIFVWIYCAVGYTVDYVLDERGFQKETFYSQDSGSRPTFTYCLSESMCEAFLVGSEYLPEWAKRSDMEIVISPEPKVLLHTDDGIRVAPEGMYILLFKDGKVGVASAEEMHRNFVKINAEEDQG